VCMLYKKGEGWADTGCTRINTKGAVIKIADMKGTDVKEYR